MFALLVVLESAAQERLTVEKIMQDPKWIGASPDNLHWSPDAKTLYFLWNPENATDDSLYAITVRNTTPAKVKKADRKHVPPGDVVFSRAGDKVIFEKFGDIFYQDLSSGKTLQVTNTTTFEYAPQFSADEARVFYTSAQNLYSWDVGTGIVRQWTDFRKEKEPGEEKLSSREKWLRDDQLALFDVLRQRKMEDEEQERIRESENPRRPKEIYLDDKNVAMVDISPSEKYITFRLTRNSRGKRTIVPSYVTESGYTEDLNARPKVGSPAPKHEFHLYDVEHDTVVALTLDALPGITDKITFTGEDDDDRKKEEERAVSFFQVSWSPDGSYAVVVVRAYDNKDRWIALLDPRARKLKPLHRLHDDAWVSYSTGWSYSNPQSTWIDNRRIWFLSEETGYQHLYVMDVVSGEKKALTQGNYEVQRATLPRSKKYFYLITNEVHPGEKQLYRLPVAGGKAVRLTTMTGAYEAELSPDEKYIALRYSYANKPWELYLMENKPGATAQQITHSLSEAFRAYPWRDPEVVTFKARDNATLYARLYKPQRANGAAVVFVHGAGYLQNAHKWWSSYFREYMFHNLLADKGYTVLDIDYRASAGYGRDWRTAIYQFMGGKDLEDNVDGAKYLVDVHGIDPERIGIYGGSYGGFITLMALFTTPDVFAAGAALRPVTDWAHYNHGYTANILNVPYMDSLAYAKSSPIYYAEGLKNPLLICHGMVDTNVHFQDVVRLAQRLIELGKEDWEVAMYPVESHGFVEPSSWTDEYKRILKLFETHLTKEAPPVEK